MAKVLLVDDNQSIRTLYREIFGRNGFEICEAADGLAAVDVAVTERPNIIILDLMLPRQGGLGTLKVFRTLPETKDTPIIILTALPNPEYQVQAKPYVQGFFLKTQIRPQQLVDAAQALVKNRA